MSKEIVLGGGCFWCVEGAMLGLRGVSEVVPGYSGGQVENPTYEQVCGKRTGHAEVVKVIFDPEIISQRILLEVFFTVHDPTSINRQGADVGTQYRSAIFCKPEERSSIVNFIQELESQGIFKDKIVTEVNDIQKFFVAEDYHHDYFTKNPENAYCQAVINPKLNKLRSLFSDLISE